MLEVGGEDEDEVRKVKGGKEGANEEISLMYPRYARI